MAAPLLIGVAALGASAMYLLDPTQGRRRRARIREQIMSRINHADEAAGVAARDLGNRARGILPRLRLRVGLRREIVPDEVLVERVRSRLGRAVSHPGAIDVEAMQGSVRLSGSVLAAEHAHLLHEIHAVPGVKGVEDHTAVHESAEHIPELQGTGRHPGSRFELLQKNWSPAARVLVGAAGSALLLEALRERGFSSLFAGAAGAALLVRSTTNTPLRRLLGIADEGVVDIHKSIHVDAPVEQVFEVLSHYENFPHFMSNVRSVQLREDGTSHWEVCGPAGQTVEWDAVTTQREPNRLLSWRTQPGSTVDHAGTMRFAPFNGGTRVEITMSYNPPGGALGHVVARLFGADPKTELDEDLLRMKMFVETGKAPRDAAATVRH